MQSLRYFRRYLLESLKNGNLTYATCSRWIRHWTEQSPLTENQNNARHLQVFFHFQGQTLPGTWLVLIMCDQIAWSKFFDPEYFESPFPTKFLKIPAFLQAMLNGIPYIDRKDKIGVWIFIYLGVFGSFFFQFLITCVARKVKVFL